MVGVRDLDGSDDAISRFWVWWRGARPRIESAIASGEWGELPSEIAEFVHAVDDRLQWELAPGTDAEHALMVSTGGDRELRQVVDRWVASAPAVDSTWEFHTARQASPAVLDRTISFEGREVDLQLLEFAIAPDTDRRLVDVVAYHPSFAESEDRACGQITFLALDWLLGERAVEDWIGVVSWSVVRPDDAGPPAALTTAVGAIAATA